MRNRGRGQGRGQAIGGGRAVVGPVSKGLKRGGCEEDLEFLQGGEVEVSRHPPPSPLHHLIDFLHITTSCDGLLTSLPLPTASACHMASRVTHLKCKPGAGVEPRGSEAYILCWSTWVQPPAPASCQCRPREAVMMAPVTGLLPPTGETWAAFPAHSFSPSPAPATAASEE